LAKGRKVRSLGLKFIRKGAIVLSLNLATLRLGEKISESELFAQATQILNYSRARSKPANFSASGSKESERGKTLFPNEASNYQLGGQFAAVGGVVLDRAREKGFGRDLPPEWFAQTLLP
jgi:hypothetical protein